jgi:flavin-dependent dehydrogenase
MSEKPHILIAGGGVAGPSLAIRLAQQNFRVTLVERDKFPRHKLCGEFVSPECLLQFKKLGVLDEMMAIGGDQIAETVFYTRSGRSVSVPSGWFENGDLGALSISRAEMDLRLVTCARQLGAEVMEETSITRLTIENGRAASVRIKDRDGKISEIAADLFVDATGRAQILSKQAAHRQAAKTKFVAFKTHLENANVPHGVCEIYGFDGGYGGLSWVEGGKANCCFIIRSDVVRRHGSDVERIFREVVLKNRRAKETMDRAEPTFPWIAVSIDAFGKRERPGVENLIPIGDAAAFIDPFTGSGMLMAMESSELLAEALAAGLPAAAEKYYAAHQRKFARRLAVCKWMRAASFSPRFASLLVFVLNLNKPFRHLLAKNTRSGDTAPSHNFPL